MNKFKKILSALAVVICFGFGLASCNSNSFYKEWKDAGATIEEDNCFKLLSVDDVVSKRENKESFIIFLGASAIGSTTNQTAVDLVSNIQAEADAVNYDGCVYFVNVKDAAKNLTEGQAVKDKLGVNELLGDSNGLVCVSYIKGDVYFDTSKAKKSIPDQLKRFVISGSISFEALANYAFEYYKVEK